MKRTILYLICILLATVSLKAQTATAPRAANNSVQTTLLSSFKLPAKTYEICFLDGKLHISTEGMLFAVGIYGDRLGFPEIDTALTTIDPLMTYAVRHPSTGAFYYTKNDTKGVSQLYEYYERKPGKFDSRRIKPYGFSYSIEHPIFSADGRAMVFASDCPIGFGGRDLWFCEMRNGEWQYPQNMGHRINTEGDESMPAIYGEFLIFASDGRGDSYGQRDLYATRLVALEQTGDTVMMYPIGRSAVHSIEAPFCSADDDFGFTTDGSTGGWWLSRDTAGNEVFHSYSGRLDCVRLSGKVTDTKGQVMAGAEVTVNRGRRDETVIRCNSEGEYTLFLQPDREYELSFAAQDHFVYNQVLSLSRNKEDRLYAEENYNVTLLGFDLDTPYSYADLFGSSVSSELSAAGRTRVDAIARFLTENPHLKLTIVSAYDQSDDKPFCSLLNNSRLRTLNDYVVAKGVPQSAIATSTTRPSAAAAQDEAEESMLPGAAQSSLTVFFIFSR